MNNDSKKKLTDRDTVRLLEQECPFVRNQHLIQSTRESAREIAKLSSDSTQTV